MLVILNAYVDDWKTRPVEIQPFPQQLLTSAISGVLGVMTSRFEDFDSARACMPCGQGAGGIRDIPSCAEIVERVMREARETIERLAALI